MATSNSSSTTPSRRAVHTLAAATTLLALLPIGIGAVVTTMDAGMAFPDWPTSHGQGMLEYPWLKSAGDEFVEHGHRLAGMLIGICSLALLALTWFTDRRPAARTLAVVVVLGVIAQGILGGVRVLADDRTVAMIHGQFAAGVFTAMGMLTLITSRRWNEYAPQVDAGRLKIAKFAAAAAIVLVVMQSAFGAMIRHLGLGLHEHLGGAVLALLGILVATVCAWRTNDRWIRGAAIALLVFCLMQISLGIAAWATKYGLPFAGIVGQQHSPLQIFVRTGHTIVAMLLLLSSFNLLVRILRVEAVQPAAAANSSARAASMPSVQALAGGPQ